jgi:peptidyl-prolyl cis-trans isomerase D
MPLMLDIMRKHSKSFLIYLLFGIIIVVFVISFGPGSECTPKGETLAAEINGRRIPITEFENIFNHDPRFQDRQKDTAELRQSAMDALVERELLAQEAERLGVRISDQELARRIRNFTWLHKDGKFNVEFYKRWVASTNSSVPVFEERLRKVFLGDELRGLLVSSVQVSDPEVEAEYWRRNTKVNLEYVELNPADLSGAQLPTPAEVAAWKKDHQKQIEEHWNTKKFLYFARKQYHVRQIALRIPPKAAPSARDELKKRLEEIRKEADAGADFAELARRHSQDEATKAKGGDLGLLERKEMPTPEFRKYATEAPVGKTSQVFCDSDYCRLLKVESTRERELKELENEIAEELLKEERAKAVAQRRAQAILAKLKADPSTDLKTLAPPMRVPQTEAEKKEAAEKKEKERKRREALEKALAKIPGAKTSPPEEPRKTAYGQTGLFARSMSYLVPKIGISKDLMRAAFQLQKKGDVAPQAFEVDKKLFVVRLLERPPVAKPTEEDLQSIRRELLALKQVRMYEQWLDALRKGAKVAVNRAVLRPPPTRKASDEEGKKKEGAPQGKEPG